MCQCKMFQSAVWYRNDKLTRVEDNGGEETWKVEGTLPYSSSTLTCLFLDTTSVPSSWLVIKIKAVGENRLKIMPRIRLKLPWWVCWPLPVPRPPQSSQRGQQCHRCSSSPSTPWIHPHQAQPQRSPDVFHGGLKYIVVQHNTNIPWFHTGCFFSLAKKLKYGKPRLGESTLA